jgi:hypothetical protein
MGTWVPRYLRGDRAKMFTSEEELIIQNIDTNTYEFRNGGSIAGPGFDRTSIRITDLPEKTWVPKFKVGDIIRYNSHTFTIDRVAIDYDEKGGKYYYNDINTAPEDGPYVDSTKVNAIKVNGGGRKTRLKKKLLRKRHGKTKRVKIIRKKHKSFTKKLI